MSTIRIPTNNDSSWIARSWGDYTRLLKLFDERRHFRITYDRGILEVVTLTYEHEHRAYILARSSAPGRRSKDVAIQRRRNDDLPPP